MGLVFPSHVKSVNFENCQKSDNFELAPEKSVPKITNMRMILSNLISYPPPPPKKKKPKSKVAQNYLKCISVETSLTFGETFLSGPCRGNGLGSGN